MILRSHRPHYLYQKLKENYLKIIVIEKFVTHPYVVVAKVEKATRGEFHPFPYPRPMKKLLFLALLSSISVVTKSWLVLDNPFTIDDVVDGTIQEHTSYLSQAPLAVPV